MAAAKRVGATSSASIDSDVSMAMMIVARSRGTLCVRAGLAKAAIEALRQSSASRAGTWRRQPGRFGATLSSSSRLVNRTA